MNDFDWIEEGNPGHDFGCIQQIDDRPCKPNPHRIPLGFDLTPYQKRTDHGPSAEPGERRAARKPRKARRKD